jgi:hypothetical protein
VPIASALALGVGGCNLLYLAVHGAQRVAVVAPVQPDHLSAGRGVELSCGAGVGLDIGAWGAGSALSSVGWGDCSGAQLRGFLYQS